MTSTVFVNIASPIVKYTRLVLCDCRQHVHDPDAGRGRRAAVQERLARAGHQQPPAVRGDGVPGRVGGADAQTWQLHLQDTDGAVRSVRQQQDCH